MCDAIYGAVGAGEPGEEMPLRSKVPEVQTAGRQPPHEPHAPGYASQQATDLRRLPYERARRARRVIYMHIILQVLGDGKVPEAPRLYQPEGPDHVPSTSTSYSTSSGSISSPSEPSASGAHGETDQTFDRALVRATRARA